MFMWSRATLGAMNGENGFMRAARVPYRVLYALLFTLVVVIIVLLLPSDLRSPGPGPTILVEEDLTWYTYNTTYPLSSPIHTDKGVQYRIGLVADEDERSKASGEEYTWQSYLKTGTVTVHKGDSMSVTWDSDMTVLKSSLAEKGRGAELSELVVFNGKLYTVDDRSGIVYEIRGTQLVPWVILENGPGNVPKGFKAEWMTVKDHLLYVGGLGKVWTTQTGEYVNDYPQYIKIINPQGHVEHRPWASVYNRIKDSIGISSPGYVIHESACWSTVHRKWFFLPRRVSHESYDDVEDEHRAANLMITADEAFADIHVSTAGPLNKYRGFSSFKFVPGSRDSLILALKSEEVKGNIATYMIAFNLDGQLKMKEQKIATGFKFEGLEFI